MIAQIHRLFGTAMNAAGPHSQTAAIAGSISGLAALFCASLIAPSALGANAAITPRSQLPVNAVLTTNATGQLALELSPNPRPAPLAKPLAEVTIDRPEFTVWTNIGGIWMFLHAPTNSFPEAATAQVELVIINGTTNQPFLAWASGDPTFGRFVVSDAATGRPLQRRETARDFVSTTGASLHPLNQLRFKATLGDFALPPGPGNYAVRFIGKLPSTERPGGFAQFETPPLPIRIGAGGAR
jgi:hypothetical protein